MHINKERGYSLIICSCITMIAFVFMTFGFKLWINNLKHNTVENVYSEDNNFYYEKMRILSIVMEDLNSLEDLKDKLNSNFVYKRESVYSLDYFKDRGNNKPFVLYIYDGPTEVLELNYKFQSISTSKDSNTKEERLVLY